MHWASHVATVVKNPPLPMQETQVRSLGQEDPLEGGMAIHFSILAWRIPWTEEPGGLQPKGLHRVGYDWSDLACRPMIIKFQSGQLKKQTFILWQFQKLDVQDQAVSSVGFFWGLSLWSSTAAFCPCLQHGLPSVTVSAQISSTYQDTILLD